MKQLARLAPMAYPDKIDEMHFYSFSQSEIIKILRDMEHATSFNDLADKDYYEKLMGLVRQYGGLCEIICNYILLKDYLGSDSPKIRDQLLQPADLADEVYANSHVVDVFGMLRFFIAMIFGYYFDNCLGCLDQYRIQGSQENRQPILTKLFTEQQPGDYTKFLAYKKSGIFFQEGHSMLIKKISTDTYSFFDPDSGEIICNLAQLLDKIEDIQERYNEIVFIDGQAYKQRLIDNFGILAEPAASSRPRP